MFKQVLGLEVHAQIATKTKLFSRSLCESGMQANTNVTWLDAGLPGSLPVANANAINLALKTALALGMHINEESIFDRKHYFYQDLPLGYQITQFYKPIGVSGILNCSFGPIRINRLHIEADAGKSIHENGNTYVDLNRVGVPLMEIVTEPDFKSAQQVVEFLKELRCLLLCLGTCKCDMEAGNFRADVNISLHKEGAPYGTRVEIKNLNSFRFISKAIEYEANLQKEKLERGELIIQETKLFDSKTQTTHSMRDKEDATDYRYFPDPDLLPVRLEKEFIDKVRENLPELPQAARKKYEDMGIGTQQAFTLTAHPLRMQFFNKLISIIGHEFGVAASNWVASELIGKLSKLNIELEAWLAGLDLDVFSKSLSNLIILAEDKKITRSHAKDLIDDLIANFNCDINFLIEQRGYSKQFSTQDMITKIRSIVMQYPDEIAKYKNGKKALLMYFVGAVMKEMKGACDPEFVKKECENILETEC